MTSRRRCLSAAALSMSILVGASYPSLAQTHRPDVDTVHGMKVFNRACSECHYDGKDGAPRLNDLTEWKRRIWQGEEVLDQHALKGYLKMPAKGGHAELSDKDVIDAVHFMIIMLRDEPAR